ncbi:MAG: hypothetical protein HOV81_06945 [Kofleriaceae bacterium]|nr:hypothetical protein [Kofleriaceae bacterium]
MKLTILDMKLNSDMEGDDDYVPFYDNRADVFGEVEINADGTPETFKVPEISESDFPHWTEGNSFVSNPARVGDPVRFVIRLREDDWGATGSNDVVDINPDPGRDDLEFQLDTCSMELTGDITQSARDTVEVPSGTGSNQGKLRFKVEMADGRPLSPGGDVALVGFDLVQVLPNVDRLVADKPAVALVTVANNTPVPQPVSVRLRVFTPNATVYDCIESMGDKLDVGEVRSKYIGALTPTSNCLPVQMPAGSCSGYEGTAIATLILDPTAEIPDRTACWALNNTSGAQHWNVVTNRQPKLLWIRTGRLLDAGHLATTSQFNTIHDLGMPFIRGVYPTSGFTDLVSNIQFIPPIAGGVYDFLATLLTGFGVPADAATPFAIVYELDAVAALVGVDRIMGVLPKAWFDNFLYGIWDRPTGLSLGEWHSRAVIFESESKDSDGNTGPKPTLPGHELGHTYGLSLDPTIKDDWKCQIGGTLGVIACGIAGGFDEYNSSTHEAGVPTWGYWVPQGTLGDWDGLAGEQCDSNCLMGGSPMNAHKDWGIAKRWIDTADYDQLNNKLTSCKGRGPGVIYVSGVIAEDDTAVLGWIFSQPDAEREVDFPTMRGEHETAYSITFVDRSGNNLSESELPLSWTHPEVTAKLRATLFAGYASFPAGTAEIQIWNRTNGKLLAKQTVTATAPSLSAPTLGVRISGGQRFLDVSWTASDREGGTLKHFVMISPDGAQWWPVAHGLTSPSYSLDLVDVPSGRYTVRVMTTDGVNVRSQDGSISL